MDYHKGMRLSERHSRVSARLVFCALLTALTALSFAVQPASAAVQPLSAAVHAPLIRLPGPLIRLPQPPGTPPPLGGSSGGIQSQNWSGYVTTGGPFTSVQATWVQPAISPTSVDGSHVAFWVGLDGDGSSTVEQIGTDSSCNGGVVSYVAWYEMYPANAHVIALTVHAGDELTASVAFGTSFTLTLTDQTTGQSFTTVKTLTAAQRLSAEIITEAPSTATSVLPLADFGLVDFSACTVNGQSLSAFDPVPIYMVTSGGTWEIGPSALGSDGESFSVAADHSAPTTTASGLRTNDHSGWINHSRTVTLSAADDRSGVAYTFFTSSASPGVEQTYSAPFQLSGGGSQSVTYWSVDNAGNVEAAHTGYVNIDTTAPTTRVDAASIKHNRTVSLRYRIKDRPPSCGSATVTLKICQGSTLKKRLALGSRATNAALVCAWKCTLGKGSYTIKVYATDAAGNEQSRVGTATLTVE